MSPVEIGPLPDFDGGVGVVHLQISNRSTVTRTLQLDVADQFQLVGPGDHRSAPSGCELPGLDAGTLAARGVVSVDIPSGGHYDFYPVFSARVVRAADEILLAGVGSVRLPGHSNHRSHRTSP